MALEVHSAIGEALSVDQLELRGLSGFTVSNGNDALTPPEPLGTAIRLPVQLAVLPPSDYLGPFQLEVRGRLANQTLRVGLLSGSIDRNQHLAALVVLDHLPDGTMVGTPDLAGRDFSGVDLSGLDLANPFQIDDLSQPCDPVLQSGCGTLQKCTLEGASESGAPICAAAGSLPIGNSCNSDDQCVAGSICLTLTGVDHVCRKLCNHDNLDDDCPKPPVLDAARAQESHCLQLTVNGSLGECSLPCNPVNAAGPSGCPTGQMCYFVPFVNADILGLTDCTSLVGSKTDGQVCTTRADCAPGLYCREITQGGQLVCREMCRIGMDSDCTLSGYKCVQDIVSFGGSPPQRDLLTSEPGRRAEAPPRWWLR